MKGVTVFHSGKHDFSYKCAAVFLFFLCIPSFIHGKYFHFLFFHSFMMFILHMEPHTVHLLKKYRYGFRTLCLVCIHLVNCMHFFLVNSFTQTLYKIPYPLCTDGLTTGFINNIGCNTIWGFCNCQRYLFCKIC